MKRINQCLLPLAGILLLALSPAEGAVGDATLDCMCVTLTDPDDHHLFTSSGDRAYKCDTPGCHTGASSGFCSSEHAGCGGFAALDAFDTGAAELSLQDATILAMEEGVVFNVERGALQTIGCNGTVIASVNVPQRYAAVLAAVALLKYV